MDTFFQFNQQAEVEQTSTTFLPQLTLFTDPIGESFRSRPARYLRSRAKRASGRPLALSILSFFKSHRDKHLNNESALVSCQLYKVVIFD